MGCPATDGFPNWGEPNGFTEATQGSVGECYAHDSLVTDQGDCTNQSDGTDYCDRPIGTLQPYMRWGYYVEPPKSGNTVAYSIWDSGAFTPEVCYGQNSQYSVGGTPQLCGSGPSNQSTEWKDHIRIPQGLAPYPPGLAYSYAPIFDDIRNCQLPAISWVVPSGLYSDHPNPLNGGAGSGPNTISIGPSWVGNIVDAIGNSYENGCGVDYWGYPAHQGETPEPTAIFVVWDDWGGWFDHVPPPKDALGAPLWPRIDQNSPPTGYRFCDPAQDQWGCGYTDGFRVPLLVLSEYTPAGYVSGACGTNEQNSCPYFGPSGTPYQYVHDFGSILRYTELNFGMPHIQNHDTWEYADYNAPDDEPGNVPLSDFFGLWNGGQNPSPRAYTPINPPYHYQCFTEHQNTGDGCPLANGNWVAADPDSY